MFDANGTIIQEPTVIAQMQDKIDMLYDMIDKLQSDRL